MSLPVYATLGDKIWHYSYLTICTCIFIFLIAPIFVIIPLSFNVEPYFSFTEGMLSLDPDAYSLRWYRDFFESDAWISSVKNSLFIAIISTLLSTTLGTLAAVGLTRSEMPYKGLIMGIMLSPMIVPLIISAAGMYFFYARFSDFTSGYVGIILAHTVLGTPFVVITVTATLAGFNDNLIRASQSLGASGMTTFFKVVMPLILPGVISGGLFAFITSFDEVVIALFLTSAEERTVTIQMWSGIREEISPTILAVATLLIILSVIMLLTLEMLRRRGQKLKGEN